MAGSFSVSTTFKSKDRMSKTFDKMSGRAKAFGGVLKGVLGANVIMKGVQLLSRGLRAVGSEFVAFDQAIISASAKFKGLDMTTEAGIKTFELLGETARDIASKTQFSAGQMAEGLDFLAMAGFTAEQAMASLDGVVNLATVANIDLARATDIASDSLGAFGLMTEDAEQLQINFTRQNDVMAATMTSTNTSMEDLFESIKKGAPAFTAAGQSMETFNALTGAMANSGIKGSEAGTSLRNVMLRLANPAAEAAELMDQLGIVTQDSQGNFLDVIDIIGQFETATASMGTAQKTAALSTVFGARSVTGINILLQEGTENLRSFRTELENSTGASLEMANVMRGSLQNRLASLKSAAIEVGFQFFDAFKGDIGNAIEFITDKVRNIDLKPVTDAIRTVISFISRNWGKIQFVFDKVTTTIKSIYQGFIALFKGDTAGATEFFTKAWEDAKDLFSTIWKGIGTIFNNVWTTIQEKFPGLASVIQTVIDTVSPVLIELKGLFGDIFDTILSLFKGDTDEAVLSFTSAIERIPEILKKTLSAMADIITAAIPGLDPLLKIVEGISSVALKVSGALNIPKHILDAQTNKIEDQKLLEADRATSISEAQGREDKFREAQALVLERDSELSQRAPLNVAPNQAEVEAQMQLNIGGNININGAPAGTTANIQANNTPLITGDVGVQ